MCVHALLHPFAESTMVSQANVHAKVQKFQPKIRKLTRCHADTIVDDGFVVYMWCTISKNPQWYLHEMSMEMCTKVLNKMKINESIWNSWMYVWTHIFRLNDGISSKFAWKCAQFWLMNLDIIEDFEISAHMCTTFQNTPWYLN